MMLQIQRAVAHASAVVLGHSYNVDVQRQVADVLFAKASADGQLSASLGELFPTGAGVTITPKTPLHFVPEEYGLSSTCLLYTSWKTEEINGIQFELNSILVEKRCV